MLTTLTPVWNRPNMVARWLQAIRMATDTLEPGQVEHILMFVGEPIPGGLQGLSLDMRLYQMQEKPGMSIGHYHNIGAQLANTEWIMKLDIDTLPNTGYFHQLIPLLKQAPPRMWFNGGMVYVNRLTSLAMLPNGVPLFTHDLIMGNRRTYCTGPYLDPAASNFICRKEDYLSLGGCDERFQGYGWEDYQQLYMLERHWRQADPLPGPVTLENAPRRCRDEISRPKARELWQRDKRLCLLHHWHPGSKGTAYKNPSTMANNRRILLDNILKARTTKGTA